MKNLNKWNTIPEPTLRRLSHYVVYLQKLAKEGVQMVSSTRIAEDLYFDATQVRKDLQFTGISGHPKIGFHVTTTLNEIRRALNFINPENAFLVGVGNLGRSVLNFSEMNNLGINIVAAFDTDPNMIGKFVNGIEILNIDRLLLLAKLMKVKIGILCVPESAAQSTADLLVQGGISAIWNLLSCRIRVPKDIIIEEANMLQSLAVLTNKLALAQRNEI